MILLFFDVFFKLYTKTIYIYLYSKLFQILTFFIHLSFDLTVIVNVVAEYREYSASVLKSRSLVASTWFRILSDSLLKYVCVTVRPIDHCQDVEWEKFWAVRICI